MIEPSNATETTVWGQNRSLPEPPLRDCFALQQLFKPEVIYLSSCKNTFLQPVVSPQFSPESSLALKYLACCWNTLRKLLVARGMFFKNQRGFLRERPIAKRAMDILEVRQAEIVLHLALCFTEHPLSAETSLFSPAPIFCDIQWASLLQSLNQEDPACYTRGTLFLVRNSSHTLCWVAPRDVRNEGWEVQKIPMLFPLQVMKIKCFLWPALISCQPGKFLKQKPKQIF